MAPPQREDFNTIIRGLQQRIERLERSQTLLGISFPMPNVAVEPDAPAQGVIIYSYNDHLKCVTAAGARSILA